MKEFRFSSWPIFTSVWSLAAGIVLLHPTQGGFTAGISALCPPSAWAAVVESTPACASVSVATELGDSPLKDGHAVRWRAWKEKFWGRRGIRLRGGNDELYGPPVLEGGSCPGVDEWWHPKKHRKHAESDESHVPPLEGGGLPMGVKKESVVSPFEVQGKVDYDRIVTLFGSQPLTSELVDRLERVTGVQAHYLVKRGFVFSHRDLDKLLSDFQAGKKFFLYTGRGPSSTSMHIGHLIPFMLTRWLQEAFQARLVIQLTDDEKFLWKGGDLEQYSNYAIENARDIVAMGFDESLTFVFTDTASMDMMYPNDMPCLVPCAIDQDPYFRMTRDVAAKLGLQKPALLHCKFIPSLQGDTTKMSASQTQTAIYLTDTPKEIKKKMNKYAFSGGQATVELHRQLGGDLKTDVAYRYLEFFEPDDARLRQVGEDYKAGRILSGEMKAIAIECLQGVIQRHQAARALVTDSVLQGFMRRRPLAR